MNPVSPYFLAYLSVAVSIYYLSPLRLRTGWLAFCSLVFVGLSSWGALIILIIVILFNFYFAFRLNNYTAIKRRHLFLLVGIGVNAGVLGLIKYHNVWNRGSHKITQWIGVDNPMPPIHWIIPLGLSYYTFQAIGYQIEVYRGNHKPETSLSDFATYLSFFPKITAGPIERSGEFLVQLKKKISLEYANLRDGFRLILWGFFKFMIVAKTIGADIDPVFDNMQAGWNMVAAIALYPVQLYAEFSGYTDVALGSARMFGIQLRPNFNAPFLSSSLSDFWRKWHISLSTWIMDYVFTPLSMWFSLRVTAGKFGVAVSVFLSFLLVGMWHGTDWNYAVFGLIQGSVLGYEISTSRWRKKALAGSFGRAIGIISTLFIFIFSSLFFKAQNIPQAIHFLDAAFDLTWNRESSLILSAILTGMSFLFVDHWLLRLGFEIVIGKAATVLRWLIYAAMIYAIAALSSVEIQTITYGQF